MIAILAEDGFPDCIANEDGERQIACAVCFTVRKWYVEIQDSPCALLIDVQYIASDILKHTCPDLDEYSYIPASQRALQPRKHESGPLIDNHDARSETSPCTARSAGGSEVQLGEVKDPEARYDAEGGSDVQLGEAEDPEVQCSSHPLKSGCLGLGEVTARDWGRDIRGGAPRRPSKLSCEFKVHGPACAC